MHKIKQYVGLYVHCLNVLPLAMRACVLPQSPSPAARSKALSSSLCCRRFVHTDSKTNRMTEDSEPVEQHHFRYFGQNIH